MRVAPRGVEAAAHLVGLADLTARSLLARDLGGDGEKRGLLCRSPPYAPWHHLPGTTRVEKFFRPKRALFVFLIFCGSPLPIEIIEIYTGAQMLNSLEK